MKSKHFKSKIFSACLITAASFVMTACEESGGNTFSGGPTTTTETNGQPVLPTGTTPYTLTGVNGPLKGEFWSTATGERINLDTGETKTISGYQMYPRADGLEYIEFITEYRGYPGESCYGGFSADSHAFVIRDTVTGLTKSFFEFRSRVNGPIKLSPDGQTVAFWANSLGRCDDSWGTTPILVTREGEFIIQGNDNILGFDWMPDSRLVYMRFSDGEYQLITENRPNTLSGFKTASIPPLGGSPSRFRISPDGQQVLIEVVTGTPVPLTVFSFREATVWQMNIDGSNLRKIADTSRDSLFADNEFADPLVNEPVWSPDGQNILVTENYKSGVSTSFYGTQTENHTYIESISVTPVNLSETTYVMPATTDFVRLPPPMHTPDGVRPLFALNDKREFRAVGVDPTQKQHWTQAISEAPTNVGSMPAPNGFINRGITGTLYAHSAEISSDGNPSMGIYDLSTGETVKVELKRHDTFSGAAKFTKAVDVSKSGNFFVALEEPDDFDYYDMIGLYDRAGNLIDNFYQEGSDYDYQQWNNRIKFSPAKENFIAYKYYGNYKKGIVVLDTERRAFRFNFNELSWDTFAWMPNGDLLLVYYNNVYIARASSSGGFFKPKFLFAHTESFPIDIAVSPDGLNISYTGTNGDLYIVGTDGGNYRRVTAPTTADFFYPTWSPDSKYISALTSGGRYIFSADAQNLKIYFNHIQHGLMPAERLSLWGKAIWR